MSMTSTIEASSITSRSQSSGLSSPRLKPPPLGSTSSNRWMVLASSRSPRSFAWRRGRSGAQQKPGALRDEDAQNGSDDGEVGETEAGQDRAREFSGRILHIPKPKGGEVKAFDIPLSRAMIHAWYQFMQLGRVLYPTQAQKSGYFPLKVTADIWLSTRRTGQQSRTGERPSADLPYRRTNDWHRRSGYPPAHDFRLSPE